MKRVFLFVLILQASLLAAQEKLPRKLYVEIRAEDELLRTVKFFTEVVLSEYSGIIVVEDKEESDCVLSLSVAPVPAGEADESAAKEKLRITVSGYDSYFQEEKFTYEYVSDGYSIIGLQEEFFPELVVKTAEAFPPRDPEIEEVFTERVVEDVEVKRILKGVALTLKAAPGTTVTSKTGDVYRTDALGEVLIELPFDTTFSFRAEHPDYFPENETVLVGREEMEYTLQQTRNRRWGFDAGLRIWAIGLEAAGVFYPIPNRLFLSLHLTSNAVSVMYFTRDYPVFLTPSLNVGIYLLPTDSFVRFAFSAGLFTRIVFPEGEAPYISPLVTFGGHLPLRLELSPFKRVRFFIEYKPSIIYMSGDRNFFYTYSALQMLSITDHLYLNFGWNLILGTRVLL
jgi:hypothetical protein